ncbi:30S ribosomal protein THX [Sediminibacterium sp.]|uniref:30S ribosomal protein THX n=1 Tax=Sediminibacterium sp. TaxID=1917865 RepID=UPI002732DA65|nr:30S ribosomal protein THX [Sediminibacterium sp.]MDP3394327.1 30S ribosomal protein THX [Sediminibacterium sp.]MDP3568162.1 30S ribosomal protein THX [Sediminibacterium sp.]
MPSKRIEPRFRGVFLFLHFIKQFIQLFIMGRGDKKTAKGKRFQGSFGKSRPANPVAAKKAAAKKAATKAS